MRLLLLLSLIGLGAVWAESKPPQTKPLDELIFSQNLWSTDLVKIKEQFGSKKSKNDEKDRLGVSPQTLARLKERGVDTSSMKVVLPELDWLSSAKEGLRTTRGGYSIKEKEVGEIVMRSTEGKVSAISISLYNRGDDELMGPSSYQNELEQWKTTLDNALSVRPKSRNQRGSLPISGWMWQKNGTAFLLEGSLNRREKKAEFIRLRIAPLNATTAKKTTARRGSLAERVVEDGSSVSLKGIPMVDQGDKGYCVVATVERVIRYYGRNFDQHEMASLADTSNSGTTIDAMEKAFRSITGKANVRTIKLVEFDENQLKRDIRYYNRAAKKAEKPVFPYDVDEWYLSPSIFWSKVDPELFRQMKSEQNGFDVFNRKIKEYIDQGVPICWTLVLGMFKEGDLPQSFGGHMRLIIGYDEEKKEIIYSDSWGEGHESKRMPADQAFCMTTALYAMVPTR